MEKSIHKQEADGLDHSALKWIHPHQLITGQDLERFRQKLIIDLSEVIKAHLQITSKKWLKSHEVCKLLKISPGTLQHLKNIGTIPFTKIGGAHYYDFEKLLRLLNEGERYPARN
jgi:hypothetical protein